jgi:mannosyltransferase
MTLKARWGLIGILALGLALRCIELQGRSIAYDDAFSFFLARQDFSKIVSGTAADTMPPLYYFLLHGWIALGGSQLWWLRLLSVGLNLAAVVVLFLLVRSLAGQAAGLWAGFLGVISPLQIYHAQDLRMYALLAFCQLLYCLFFVRIYLGKRAKMPWLDWIGLVLAGAGAMYTHNLAVFVLAIPDLYLLIKRDWRTLSRLLIAQVAIGLVALPWLAMIPGQVDKIQRAFWTPRPGLVEIIQAVILTTSQLPLPGIWLTIGLAASLVVVVIIAWETIRLWRGGKLPGFLAALAFFPPLLLFIISYIMRPVFVTRGFLAAMTGFLGLAGVVIARRWPALPAGLVLLGFISGAAIGLPFQYSFEEFPRSPYQAAMDHLRTVMKPGDQIVHDNKLSFFPSYYYAPDLPQNFLMDEPGSPNDTFALASQQAMDLYPQKDLEQAVGASNHIFFILFDTTLQEYLQSGSPDHPQLAWLKQHFRLAGQSHYNDLLVYEFTR